MVLPTVETVHDKTYPYARPNFFYTNGEPTGLAAQFVEYLLSADGQAIVAKSGFVPISAAK